MIKVSVIIPTYGEPKRLEKAIKSVLQQSLKEIELIIVDDNDQQSIFRIKTEEVIRLFDNDDRIHYIKHAKNMNGAAARNTGLQVATGEYISFLDSDDEYCGDRLKILYERMQSASDSIAGVYSGCEFRRNGKKYHVTKTVKSGNYLVETLACTFAFCSGSNIFVRKRVVDELQGFDTQFLRHQDYEFLVRLFLNYSLLGINDVLLIKNNDNENLPSPEKVLKIKEQYLSKFRTEIDSLPRKDKNFVYHKQYLAIAELFLKNGNKKQSNHYYKVAREFKRLSFKEVLRRVFILMRR